MNRLPLTKSAVRRTALVALTTFASAFLAEPALAGTGTFKDGKFNFCVSVRFNASPAQLTAIQQRFERANQFLADATDGQHQFGTISIINNSGASEEAEFWIFPTGSRADANSQFGLRRTHVSMYFGSNFSTDLDRNALTIVHEFAHHAYDLKDEYAKPSEPNNEEPFASCPPPAEWTNRSLSYCIMDDFTRGERKFTAAFSVTEFCVASNHDPDRDTRQSVYKHESCWETMSHLIRPWRLNLPNGLPLNPAPATQPVVFNTTCAASQNRRFMVLLDRSGSMAETDNRVDGSRLNIAKAGIGHFLDQFNVDSAPGSFVGLASFSTGAQVDFAIADVNGSGVKNGIKTAVNNLTASGATNIGESLIVSGAQLNGQGGGGDCMKTIILISDGDHNFGIPPESVITELQQSNIKVVAVALGASISVAGEAALKNVAAQTGGAYFRAPKPYQLFAFLNKFANDYSGFLPGVEVPLITEGGDGGSPPSL